MIGQPFAGLHGDQCQRDARLELVRHAGGVEDAGREVDRLDRHAAEPIEVGAPDAEDDPGHLDALDLAELIPVTHDAEAVVERLAVVPGEDDRGAVERAGPSQPVDERASIFTRAPA